MRERIGTRVPPMEASEEATESQLNLAREQGDAYRQALKVMAQEVGFSEVQRVGDYEISVVSEKAEGLYELVPGTLGLQGPQLQWRAPHNENCHIEVVVRDAADGRFIPELPVHVSVYDSSGRRIGSHKHDFLWHPWLYHYGHNWRLPGDGNYRVHVRIDPPRFPRHDRTNGLRYSETVDADFEIPIETGIKAAG